MPKLAKKTPRVHADSFETRLSITRLPLEELRKNHAAKRDEKAVDDIPSRPKRPDPVRPRPPRRTVDTTNRFKDMTPEERKAFLENRIQRKAPLKKQEGQK